MQWQMATNYLSSNSVSGLQNACKFIKKKVVSTCLKTAA